MQIANNSELHEIMVLGDVWQADHDSEICFAVHVQGGAA